MDNFVQFLMVKLDNIEIIKFFVKILSNINLEVIVHFSYVFFGQI